MSAQNPKPIGAIGAFLGLIGFSALAGVLVTAMVTPAIAVTSVTANNTVAIFNDLPDYLEFGELGQRNELWATQGGQPVKFADYYNENRVEVGWDAISPYAKDAAIAIEDERFYQHGGVDVAGIARAAVNNVTSDGQQGASTITQQLVKNILINEALKIPDEADREREIEAAQETSLERKLKEAKLAIGLEKKYTKQEILQGYLNIAGFGGNTYGIESAAQLYFRTTAAALTPAQAAALIAIVQNPESLRLNIPENRPANLERRNLILGNMLDQGMLDQAQYDEAFATPLDDTTILYTPPNNGCQYAAAAKHFCDYVLRVIDEVPSLGATPEERLENFKLGGYKIYTTIDLDQQAEAERILAERTPATESRFALGSALSTLQVGTGQIRVMAQNKGYINEESADPTVTSVNFNTDSEYGGSTGFQVGSTYKLFTLVNWLQTGHGLNEVVNAAPARYTLPLGDCEPTLFTAEPERNWQFRNDNNASGGRMTVTRATTGSWNAGFADMASKLSVCDIRATAESMGVHRADGNPLRLNSTMILGTDEIAPMSMTNAYATVANGGILCQPIAIDRLVDRDGAELPGQSADCQQAIDPGVAAAAASALRTVMQGGGTGQAALPGDGVPLIGKTGTADATSTFLSAASTKLASSVWVGNIVGKQDLRRTNVAGVNGGQVRFRVMRSMLASLNASAYNAGAGQFPTAPRVLVNGTSQPVPNVAGQTVDQARSVIESLGLDFAEGPQVPSEIPAGRVVGTDPGAGAQVSKGTTITVQISDGSLATTMPNVVGAQLGDARNAINGAGFTGGIVEQYVLSGVDVRCQVASSDPGSGATVSKSARVTLTINGGPALTPGNGCG